MRLLSDLSLLYLAVAQSGDDTLSNVELETVTDRLQGHFPQIDRAEVQNIVLEALNTHLPRVHLYLAAREVVQTLGEGLSAAQKGAVLHDLHRIARADGVLLDAERDLLSVIAAEWEVAPSQQEAAFFSGSLDAGEDALSHLAFIYLVLAHGTDHDLSEDERQLILKKLREWRPSLEEGQVGAVLEQAMQRYARGATPEMLSESVEVVRVSFPGTQRRAALNDLVQIANADGVFLDSEEDLLNELRVAWDLASYSGYMDHGEKE